ncbi:protein tyrosine phosphatase [Stutzerimonas stutzeri]|uniref:arsenate reductase ArsC n=1 Tax=Stutzerimonas stutzeri subgroup TaxID=578833 RepID=UPI0008CE27A2|nr:MULTISPECIES: arsenate reductase ArsC [Stutzerimonas stutzeri subgroup]OHC16443.1 MAG: ArsC family transcriptional regulator [Pseudomonadales bacterium GWC2_63_15]MCQ2046222.1 arsenate reductase ArsC [Stutzerimonas kunmingensis]PKR26916.1 low molecular weight phosphatase family protein [Stutzerimonas stutzeri]QQC09722.1 arsenate reductase ArsC [Stutzerimonas stutzeri]VEI34618.1 protein tyrosine phosphatase [Stutzerimonas stutzeri]
MKILFLCTANSCRSILAEALFNQLAPAGMRAFSAGSEPRGEINPLTLEALARAGIAADGLYSKSSDAHQALNPDFVITVCDKAAGEACPVHFGPATKAHWGLADPSESVGSPEEIKAAFDATLVRLKLRFTAFLALPLAQLDAATLRTELARIGTL